MHSILRLYGDALQPHTPLVTHFHQVVTRVASLLKQLRQEYTTFLFVDGHETNASKINLNFSLSEFLYGCFSIQCGDYFRLRFLQVCQLPFQYANWQVILHSTWI